MSLVELMRFAIKQGDSWAATLVATEDDGVTPIDLTGWSVEFSVARERGGRDGWVRAWVDDERHARITNAAAGEIKVGLLPEDSRFFGRVERIAYEVTLEDPGGWRLTVLDGEFLVRLEVSS